ncbi:MAG TPA: CocE/NonD family hydrolase, partial [Fimbriimonas sp.]|nr:CocE/NonD family hydrolase [Fimbriimonas sp.]
MVGFGWMALIVALGQSPDGSWIGTIDRNGKSWPVRVSIKGSTADVDLPALDMLALQFQVSADEGHVLLSRTGMTGALTRFDGLVNHGVYEGAWSGLGVDARFRLTKTVEIPPFFREKQVAFRNGAVTLRGSVILPLQGRKPFPAMVWVHSSGVETRDSARSSWAIPLSRLGIASLVYDKRGTGQSTGDWTNAGLHDLAGDGLAGLALLKKRKDIDPKRIGAGGLSQGGWIAPLMASESRGVKFVVVMSASGIDAADQSVFDVANRMRALGFSAADIKAASDIRIELYKAAKQNRSFSGIDAKLAEAAKKPWFPASSLPQQALSPTPPGVLDLLFTD